MNKMISRKLTKNKDYSTTKKESNNKIKFINHSGIKYLKDIEINGSFIVIEGPDASGRKYPNSENNRKIRS